MCHSSHYTLTTRGDQYNSDVRYSKRTSVYGEKNIIIMIVIITSHFYLIIDYSALFLN